MRQTILIAIASVTLFAASAQGRQAASGGTAAAAVWDARAAEHVLNRAGFGARPTEIRRAVALGRSAFLDELFSGDPAAIEPFHFEPIESPYGTRAYRDLPEDEQRAARRRFQVANRRALGEYLGWWVRRMLAGDDPLRERMTLFWHGYFTSSVRTVKRATPMIGQNELFREHALGSFRDLVAGVLRDPAMLRYLDNTKNTRRAPNENLARELMELFTLGEGNYTEDDVRDAARALTGYRVRGDSFFFDRKRHDGGEKTVLGVTGRHDGDDLVDILLAQEACPRWLATKLLTYFEGRAPAPERVDTYAALLRAYDFDVGATLRRLFEDPAFYDGAVVGERIASPVDYLVGSCRRLGVTPPPFILAAGASMLGEQLFNPPSVKGWEGGRSWITTASLMQRGNLAGMLLGVVSVEDVIAADEEFLEVAAETGDPDDTDAMAGVALPEEPPMSEPAARAEQRRRRNAADEYRGMRLLEEVNWRPAIHLGVRCERSGARSDAQIVAFLTDQLLGRELSEPSRDALLAFLEGERARLVVGRGDDRREGVEDGGLLENPLAAEASLRRLAHLILSLPEGQLH